MARTAYHFVKTLDFASDVALGMDSLSPKFVSSPLPKDSSRQPIFRAGVSGEIHGQGKDTYEHETPICTREVTSEHCQRRTQSSSNAKDEFCYNPQFEIMCNADGQISEPYSQSPENCINLIPMGTIINFGITSPSKVVSSKSIKDFNNNYDSNYYEPCTLKNCSNSAPGNSEVEYEKESLGEHDHLSKFIKDEPIGVPEYSLLEKGVACFLKKCKDEVVLPVCPLTNYSPDVITLICKDELCKDEQVTTSSSDDTGIGSLDDNNFTISEDSLDGRGIQYVSELKGTILRIRKLSKEADAFKRTPADVELQGRMMDFEANLKCLKHQANDLKKRIQLRNKRNTNPYYWSRSSYVNKVL